MNTPGTQTATKRVERQFAVEFDAALDVLTITLLDIEAFQRQRIRQLDVLAAEQGVDALG